MSVQSLGSLGHSCCFAEMRTKLALVLLLGALVIAVSASGSCVKPANVLEASQDSRCFYWSLLDSNADNRVSPIEIQQLFAELYHHDVSKNQVMSVVSKLDKNKDDLIDLAEFDAKFGKAFMPFSPIAPEQLHLALTGSNNGEMRITWVTRSPIANPMVRFGLGNPDQVVYATTSTYSVGTGLPWTGWIHTAIMKSLKPSSEYYYSVGANSPAGWSAIRPFKTAPAQASKTTVAFYGDMGTLMPMGWDVSFLLQSDNLVTPYDLIVHAGDLAYAGMGHSWEFEFLWDMLGRQIDPLSSTIPYMTAVGNHESYFNFTSFLTRFQMPSNASGGFKNFWLSFDHSYVHWIFMSTEHNYTRGSDQYNWLVSDLDKAVRNRANVPWIFLVGHRPMYASTTRAYDAHSPGGLFPVQIEPLMVKYGIDMYLCGHDHNYERTWPQVNGSATIYPNNHYINPQKPVYILQGTAGAFVGEGWVEPRPSWSAVRDQQYGYGRMTIFNATTLHYEFLSTNTDSVRDDFWLIKN